MDPLAVAHVNLKDSGSQHQPIAENLSENRSAQNAFQSFEETETEKQTWVDGRAQLTARFLLGNFYGALDGIHVELSHTDMVAPLQGGIYSVEHRRQVIAERDDVLDERDEHNDGYRMADHGVHEYQYFNQGVRRVPCQCRPRERQTETRSNESFLFHQLEDKAPY